MSAKRRTLHPSPDGFGYVSNDGRYEVTPAYEPGRSLGGRASRPSYWIVTDRTGVDEPCDYRLLSDVRLMIQEPR